MPIWKSGPVAKVPPAFKLAVLSEMPPPVAKAFRSGREMPFEIAMRTSMPLPKSALALKRGRTWSNSMSALSSISSPVKTAANSAKRVVDSPQ